MGWRAERSAVVHTVLFFVTYLADMKRVKDRAVRIPDGMRIESLDETDFDDCQVNEELRPPILLQLVGLPHHRLRTGGGKRDSTWTSHVTEGLLVSARW